MNKLNITALDPAALREGVDKYLLTLSDLRVAQRQLSKDRDTSHRSLRHRRQRQSNKASAEKLD